MNFGLHSERNIEPEREQKIELNSERNIKPESEQKIELNSERNIKPESERKIEPNSKTNDMEEDERYLQMYQRGYVEINLDAVLENLKYLKGLSKPRTKLLGVVKADAYGHGSVPIARKLEPYEFMFGFGVATPEEAYDLRKGGIKKPVLILGYSFPYSYEMLAREEIRPAVFRYDMIEALKSAAEKAGKPVRVHIKVDTGMNRIGIRPDREGLSFVKALMHQEGIVIEGIFTHFARADEEDKSNAGEQLGTFCRFIHMIEEELSLDIPVKHCANSAAILQMPQADMDMVRAGIAMYGLSPSGNEDFRRLWPALSFYSHIVYVKTIEKGESVSYGGTFTADRRMRVATIPIGYGDGYPRELSNRGYVLLHGRKAPILGRVCMDQFMVDITEHPEAAEGDRAVLLGRDGSESVSAEALGKLSGRFHYEIICGLGKRVPRVYRENGRIIK